MENILDDMFGNSSQFTENQDQSQAIYTKVGSNLEEIIWPHAKKLHHVTHHRRNKGSTDSGQTNEEYDDFDTRVKKEMVKVWHIYILLQISQCFHYNIYF